MLRSIPRNASDDLEAAEFGGTVLLYNQLESK